MTPPRQSPDRRVTEPPRTPATGQRRAAEQAQEFRPPASQPPVAPGQAPQQFVQGQAAPWSTGQSGVPGQPPSTPQPTAPPAQTGQPVGGQPATQPATGQQTAPRQHVASTGQGQAGSGQAGQTAATQANQASQTPSMQTSQAAGAPAQPRQSQSAQPRPSASTGAPSPAPQPAEPRGPPSPSREAATEPRVRKVEHGDDYVHVRIRDPDAFETFRTPDWAARAAGSVAEGAEVRTGKLRGSDDWEIESVLIPRPVDEGTAVQLATRIVEKIED